MNLICRKANVYPVVRFIVPDEKVPWNILWSDYAPPSYSAPHLKNCSWADPEIENEKFSPKWNQDDDGIERRSYNQNEQVKYDVADGYPLNPKGRTGLHGRGRLGRWGPNHAADALVTRWKRLPNGSLALNPENGSHILQFLAILRKDCEKWAIPGGFVNPNEKISSAVLRELFEEAVNFEKTSSETQKAVEEFFSKGKQIYKGYVDDPRNTDNAWIETTVINYHDEDGRDSNMLLLDARDDAGDVKWIDIVKNMKIYPSHEEFIKIANQIHVKCL